MTRANYIPGGANVHTSPLHDDFITGSAQPVMNHFTAPTEPMMAGQLVGINTTSKKLVVFDGTASVKLLGVMAYNFDPAAPSAPKNVPIYVAGCFNPDRIIWPSAATTIADRQLLVAGSPIFIQYPSPR